MKNKIAIIGTAGIPANYGGFETLANYLVEYSAMDEQESDLLVYCSQNNYKKEERKEKIKNASLIYLPLKANGIQSIPYDIISIIHSCFVAQSLLILGVSGCIILPVIRLFTSKKIVINIDGLEWKRDKWNKYAKWFLKFSESLAVKYADTIITDNAAIQQYVKEEYNIQSELIAYGADHVITVKKEDKYFERFPFLHEEYAFKVCRIEPENNVKLIIEAFDEANHIPLVIVGNWANNDYGQQLKKEYENHKSIFLLDPIYDPILLNLLRSNATVYVHGHSAGGTNPSLVEAMYLTLPIIAFDVSYNRETTENKALYFSDTQELIHNLKTFNPNLKESNATAMKEIAERRYRWEVVASKYYHCLTRAVNKQAIPIKTKESIVETV